MKLIIDIDKKCYDAINRIRFLLGGKEDRQLQQNVIESFKEGIRLPENPKNGDFIIALYKPYKVCENEYTVHVYMTEDDWLRAEYQMNFDSDWWNAAYKE